MSQLTKASTWDQVNLLRQLGQWDVAFQKIMDIPSIQDAAQVEMIEDVVISYLWAQWSPFLRDITTVPVQKDREIEPGYGTDLMTTSAEIASGSHYENEYIEEEQENEDEETDDEGSEGGQEYQIYEVDIYHHHTEDLLVDEGREKSHQMIANTISMQAVELLLQIRKFQATLYNLQQVPKKIQQESTRKISVSGAQPTSISTVNNLGAAFNILRLKLHIWVYLLSPFVSKEMFQSAKKSLMVHIVPASQIVIDEKITSATELKDKLRNILLATHVRYLLWYSEEAILDITRNCPPGTSRQNSIEWLSSNPNTSIEKIRTIVQAFKPEQYNVVQPFMQHISSLQHINFKVSKRDATFFGRFGWLHL